MKKIFFLLALLTLVAPDIISAQPQALKQINDQAISLTSDVSHLTDLQFLAAELKDKTVIGLGEASHGTHEFYLQKGRVVRYLITYLDCKSVGFEMPGALLDPINHYLQDGTGDLKEMMKKIALYNTKEMFSLFEWIKKYNQTLSAENKIILFGYDNEDFWGDPFNRDRLMAGNIIKFLHASHGKSVIWAHNVHIAKDTTMARYEAMGSHLKKEYGMAYYALGFDSYQGAVNNLSNDNAFEVHQFEAAGNSYSKLFSGVKYERFFISFSASKNPLAGTRNHITNIYSNWKERKSLPIKPGIDFDGLIFIRHTTASIKNE